MRFPIQQQRLIGGLLLLGIVAGITIFLISNATPPVSEQEPVSSTAIQPFNSVVEAIPDGDKDDVIADEPENNVQKESENKTALAAIKKQVLPKQTTEKTKQIEKQTARSAEKRTTWIVQLASFSIAGNAKKFQQKVSQLGYKTKMESVFSSGKTVYRIRMNGIDNREKAESLVRTLNNRLHIKAQILKSGNE